MAIIDEYIRINVIDGDVENATKEVEALGHSVEKVGKNTKTASKSVKSGFETAESSASNLEGGVKGVVSEVQVLGKAAKTSGAAMKSALISTGIGAFIVLLGLVVDNWEAIQDFIDGSNKALQRRIDLLNNSIDRGEHELELLELKEKILEAEGKSTKEIKEQKEKIVLMQQEQNELLLENLKIQLEKERAQIKEVTLWEKIKIGALNAVGAYEKAGEALADSLLGDEDDTERLRELEKQIEEAQIRREKLKLSLLDGTKKGSRKRQEALDGVLTTEQQQEKIEKLAEQFDEVFDLKQQQDKELLDSVKNIGVEIANNEGVIQAKRSEIAKKGAEERAATDEIEYQNKLRLMDAVGSGFSSLSDIVGRSTVAGKALAVAGALIDTYAAIAGTLRAVAKTPAGAIPGYAIAQSIATGLAGFAAVKNILSVKVPGGSGGGQSFSTSQSGVSAPSFNVIGNNNANQLAESLSNQNTPLQAFVVGSNVTTAQELDRNIIQTATID